MPNPYHVRLAVSQYGEQFRAELFTEDLGDTEGDLLPARWELLDEWLPYLRQGAADLPADSARKVGKQLFEYLLGKAENSKKWTEILDQSQAQNRPVRLLIDATTDAVRDLPYGLLCEPHDNYFLLQGNRPIQFVRIVRRCTPRLLRLDKPVRLLLAAAEPDSTDLPPFGCDRWLCQLARDLDPEYNLFLCTPSGPQPVGAAVQHPREEWQTAHFTPFCRTTPETLRSALNDAHFDILHLLGHGFKAGVVLCDATGKRAEVTSGDLAKWCAAKGDQGETKLQMAFLQVCRGAQTGGEGGFAGTAQQLLNPHGGNLAVVVASPYPLDAELSTPAAARFYQRLARGENPDAALNRHLTETNWTWAFLELWVRPSALEATGDRGTFLFVSPYRGLGRFEERDAEIFFGREAEVQELGQLLSQEPVITVVGDPGSGKSSLLRAGLAHQVRQQGLLGCTNWRIVVLEPGREPARNLAMGLVGAEKASPAPWAEEAAAVWDQARWGELLRSLVDQELAKGRPLLILFDQFEEMFTLSNEPAQRRAVAETLAWMAERHRDQGRVVLGMLAEYLGVATALPGHAILLKHPKVLSSPDAEQIRKIVKDPAKLYGYSFEGENGQPDRGLLAEILNDPLLKPAAVPPGDLAGLAPRAVTPLPLLEFALERLWLSAVKRGSKEFSLEDYEKLGGLGGAIAAHAEDVYQRLTINQNLGVHRQEVAERILTCVISTRGGRRPRTRQELREEINASMDAPDLEVQVEKLIDYLVGERLLTIRTEPGQNRPVQVDLIHEVLITQWWRLQQWLGQDPKSRRLREEIQKKAQDWHSEGKPNRLLVLEGERLTDASALLKQPRHGLTAIQQEYIRACAEQRNKEEDDRRRQEQERLKAAEQLASEMEERQKAEAQARQEAEKREKAEIAKREAEAIARQKAEEAAIFEKGKREAEESARQEAEQAAASEKDKRIAEEDARKKAQEAAESEKAKAMALRKAKRRLQVAAGLIALVLLVVGGAAYWIKDIDTKRAVEEQNRLAAEAEKSKAETERLKAVGEAGLAEQKRKLQEAQALFAQATQATSDNDPIRARRLFIESLIRNDTPETRKRLSEVWNVPVQQGWSVPAVPVLQPGTRHEIRATCFGPDGKRIYVAANSPSVRIIEASSGKTVEEITALAPVTAMSVSPDGRLMGLGTEKKTVEIWEKEAKKETWTRKHNLKAGDAVRSLCFSPTGHQLALGMERMGCGLVIPDTGEMLKKGVAIHDSLTVNSISTGRRGTTTSWFLAGNRGIIPVDIGTTEPQSLGDAGVPYDIRSVALSPDSRFLAFGATVQKLRVFDHQTDTGFDLIGHRGDVLAVALAPDCRTLVSASADGTARIWDLQGKAQKAILADHSGGATSVAISPDGSRFVTGSGDGTLRLWHFTSMHRGIPASDAPVSSLAWVSHEILFSGDWTRNLVLWDTRQLTPLRRIGGSTLFDMHRVALSPDRKTVYLSDCFGPPTIEQIDLLDAKEEKADGSFFAFLRSQNDEDLATGIIAGKGRDGRFGQTRQNVSVDAAGFVLAINATGNLIAFVSPDRGVQVLDIATRKQRSIAPKLNEPVRVLGFSRDGELLVGGMRSGAIRVWEQSTGKEVSTSIRHGGPISDLKCCDRDGQAHVLTVGRDKLIRLSDLRTGKLAYQITLDACCCDISPDGAYFALGTRNGLVGLFSLQTGQQITNLTGHSNRITAVSFRTDGNVLASSSLDGSIWLWNLVSFAPLQQASPSELLAQIAKPSNPTDRVVSLPSRWTELFYLIHKFTEELPTGEKTDIALNRLDELLKKLPAHHPVIQEAKARLASVCVQLAEQDLESGKQERLRHGLTLASRIVGYIGQDDHTGLVLRARILESLGEYALAAKSYDEAAGMLFRNAQDSKSRRQMAEVSYFRARLYCKIANLPPEKRPKELEPPGVINPADPVGAMATDPWIGQATFFFRTAAENGFDEWQRLLNDSLLPTLCKDPDAAELLRRSIPGDQIVTKAWDLQGGKRYDEALDLCSFLLRSSPQAANAYHVRGRVYMAQNFSDKAIEALSRSLELDSDNIEVLRSRGQAYFKKGESAKALRDYDRAIKLARQIPQPELCLERGDVLLALKEYGRAIADYQQAVKLGVPPPEPYFQVAQSYTAWAADSKDPDEKKRLERKALDTMKQLRTDELEQLGTLFANRARWPDAAKAYSEAVARDSSNAFVQYREALVLLAQGDEKLFNDRRKRILRDFGKTDDPQAALAVIALAVLTEATWDDDQLAALKRLMKVLPRGGDKIGTVEWEAAFHFRLGKLDAAREAFEKASKERRVEAESNKELDPTPPVYAIVFCGLAELQDGKRDSALAKLEEARVRHEALLKQGIPALSWEARVYRGKLLQEAKIRMNKESMK